MYFFCLKECILTLFRKFPLDANFVFRKQVAVIRCVGSRVRVQVRQSRHQYAIWAHAI